MTYMKKLDSDTYSGECPECGFSIFKEVYEIPWNDEEDLSTFTCENCGTRIRMTPRYYFIGIEMEVEDD